MKPTALLLRLLAIAGSSLLTVSSSHAASGTWNVDADGLWSGAGNWTPGIADGSGFTASFTNDITADRTVSLDGDRTLTSLVFGDGDTGTAGSWILNNNGTSTNNLILAGTTPGITVNALGTGKTATISAIIEGTAGLVKSGDGTLVLSGSNTYTSTTTINAGTLRLEGAAPLNTGRTYTINGGAVMNLNGGATFNTSVAGNSTINGTGTLRLSGGSYTRGGGGGGTLAAALGAGGLIDIQSGASVYTWWGSVVTFAGNLATLNVDGTFGGNTGLTINAAALTGAGTIDNSSTTLSLGNGSGTFSGRIRNSASVTKNGTGTQTLSGNNDYTGNTTVSAGVLNIQHANALGTTAGNTSVTSGAALELQHATGIAIGAEALTLNGSGISNGGALRNISGTNSYAGPISLGSATRINSDAGLLTLDVASGNAITNTQNLTFGGAGNISVADNINIATGTLTKDGNGTLTLSSTNTYTGTTTVSAGTLALGHATDTLANTGAVIVDGVSAILSIAGNSDTVGAVSLKNGAQITGSGGTLTGSSYAVESGSVSAILGGSGALTKTTAGTVTLTGANSYTGATSVNGGTLLLDKTGAGTLVSTSALSLGGGTFKILGKSGAFTTAQTLGALTVNFGGSQIVLDANGGTSTTLTLANSAPTRSAGGTLSVDLSIPNTVLTSTLGLAAGTQTNTQAVLGYATVKDATSTGFATNVGGNIVRYTGAEVLTGSAPTAGANVITTPSGTSTTGSPYLTTSASPTYNSLSIDTSGATGANFLSLNGTVSLTQNALLMTGSRDFTIQGGTQLGAAASEVIVHQASTGTLTISSLISSGAGSLSKTGSGTLVLTGANNYTGATMIGAGTLRLEGGSGGFFSNTSATRNYTISSGAVLNLHSTSVPVGTANLSGTGTLLISGSGLSAGNSGRVVNMNLGAGAVIDIASGSALYNGGWQAFVWTNNKASLNVNGSLNIADGNAVTVDALTGTGTIDSASVKTLTVGNSNGTGAFSGAIGNGTGTVAFTKTGTGTQTLSGANTYTGATTISAGTLLVNGTHIATTGGAGYAVSGGATLGGTGRIAINGSVSVASTGILAPGASIGALTLDGANTAGNVLNMATGSKLGFELDGSGGTPDQLAFWNYLSGDLTLNSNTIDLSLLGTQAAGTYNVDIFRFFSNAGTTATTHAFSSGLTIGTLGTGISTATIDWNGTGDNSQTIALNYTVIPEPQSALLGGLGLLMLLRRRRS